MVLPILALIGGFVLIAWSADRFVHGAADTARHLGVSPLIIGLTVVGFGTSAPELLISAMAAWQGNPQLAIGNALGSNIANVGLVLGATALLHPLIIRSAILRREYPVMLATLFLAWGLMADGHLARIDALILAGGLVLVLGWIVYVGRSQRTAQIHGAAQDALGAEFEKELVGAGPMSRALMWLAVGLAGLLVSSKTLVWGATTLAVHFGIGDLIIGLTIVAIGTSLPEVATSIASTLKGEYDIAVGNVIGSNMFNTLGVIGIAGLLQPTAVEPELLSRDFPVMVGITLVMLTAAVRRRPPRISRPAGRVLLAGYVGYLAWLGYSLAPRPPARYTFPVNPPDFLQSGPPAIHPHSAPVGELSLRI